MPIDDDMLLEKCKCKWTKIEELKGTELSAILVHDDNYIKTKIRTNSHKVAREFHGLVVPENGIESGCITIISINFFFIYEKKCYLL